MSFQVHLPETGVGAKPGAERTFPHLSHRSIRQGWPRAAPLQARKNFLMHFTAVEQPEMAGAVHDDLARFRQSQMSCWIDVDTERAVERYKAVADERFARPIGFAHQRTGDGMAAHAAR